MYKDIDKKSVNLSTMDVFENVNGHSARENIEFQYKIAGQIYQITSTEIVAKENINCSIYF